MRLVTLGFGAADPPRYRPAGLLVARRGVRVVLDGGPGAAPSGRLDAWLVTDERAELRSQLRRLAAERAFTRTPAASSGVRFGLMPGRWSTPAIRPSAT